MSTLKSVRVLFALSTKYGGTRAHTELSSPRIIRRSLSKNKCTRGARTRSLRALSPTVPPKPTSQWSSSARIKTRPTIGRSSLLRRTQIYAYLAEANIAGAQTTMDPEPPLPSRHFPRSPTSTLLLKCPSNSTITLQRKVVCSDPKPWPSPMRTKARRSWRCCRWT